MNNQSDFTKKEHHELDLNLLKLFGRIPNNEKRLSEEVFLTKEKIKQCSILISETFLDEVIQEWDLKNEY